MVGFTSGRVWQCRCRGRSTLGDARGKQGSILLLKATYFHSIFLVLRRFLTFLGNEVWRLFFFSFKLDKANLMRFEKKLKTGFSASNSAKVQVSREYNVKDKTLPTTLRKFYPQVARLHRLSTMPLGAHAVLYVPLMIEDIYYLPIGILEQAVPLLSFFMGFACTLPAGKWT